MIKVSNILKVLNTTSKPFGMKPFILFFTFYIFNAPLFSQDSILISGQFLGSTTFSKVVIQKFGVGSYPIAAVKIKEDGRFSIKAPLDIEPGVYRFQYSQANGEYLDLILNGKEKEVSFTLDVSLEGAKNVPVISKSKENSAWYAYQQQSAYSIQKINALQLSLANYPNSTDAIVKQLETALAQEQKKYRTQEQSFLKQNASTWAALMVQNKPYLFTDARKDWRLQDFERKENYWNNINTSNPKLINTPIYTEHILEYLKYYMNPDMQFSEEEMNAGFKKSVDVILQKFGGNEETQKFALQYLQLGFKELGNEEVLQYIDEKYAAVASCTAGDDELQKRLKGYESLKIGNLAPEILLTENDGSTKTLKDFPQEKVVVVFWASWCPHCMEELPKLQAWANEQENTLVLAVSLDEDYSTFQAAIPQFPNMLHYCDLQKWNSPIVTDFYVAATPTIFVLDQERKITGKFSNFNAFKSNQQNETK
jgi:thiol-disulfide isomerase/thioredoxin